MTPAADPFYKAHWRAIDAGRMAAYRDGFRWGAEEEALYADAAIAEGERVADFGCGPGHIAVEIARRVGATGRVFALDINAEFLALARVNAEAAGVSDRLTVCMSDGTDWPAEAGALDLVTMRNTLMYVDDPAATLSRMRAALVPGGRLHLVEGDWRMMVAEPVEPALWARLVEAAGRHACRMHDIGRRLAALVRAAGFGESTLRISAPADLTGRLRGMIANMAAYAVESGSFAEREAAAVREALDRGLAEGTYLAVSPRFVLTARA